MIVVDTSAWSRLLRRRPDALMAAVSVRFEAARNQGLRPILLGIVQQEVLSGLHQIERYNRLRTLLSKFPAELAVPEDHVLAAEVANRCGRAGVATTAADCLIAAQAIRLGAPILTCDGDFDHMVPQVPELVLFP